jgi:hypothetical protein
MKPKEGLAPFKKVGVIACGALAADVRRIARRRGWDVEVHPVPALLHNRPERIAGAVERQVARLSGDYERIAVLRELGLDRDPELRNAYFGNYTRVLYLAQHPTPATRAAAQRAAAAIGLPLEQREVGDAGLERALEALLAA